MSNKERIIELLDKIPEYKIGYVLAYIQGITTDDFLDDKYCESLLQDYLQDNSADKHESISLKDFAKQEGIDL